MFIGLLLRAMKNDINLKRVAAFSKRMLQVGNTLHSQFCVALFLDCSPFLPVVSFVFTVVSMNLLSVYLCLLGLLNYFIFCNLILSFFLFSQVCISCYNCYSNCSSLKEWMMI